MTTANVRSGITIALRHKTGSDGRITYTATVRRAERKLYVTDDCASYAEAFAAAERFLDELEARQQVIDLGGS